MSTQPRYLENSLQKIEGIQREFEEFRRFYADSSDALTHFFSENASEPEYHRLKFDLERAYGDQTRRNVEAMMSDGEFNKAKDYLNSLEAVKEALS